MKTRIPTHSDLSVRKWQGFHFFTYNGLFKFDLNLKEKKKAPDFKMKCDYCESFQFTRYSIPCTSSINTM